MKTIKKPVEAQINIKKSNFIARLYPAKDKKEVKKIIEEVSTRYSDATHNCTAYIVSDSQGYDDNGEPSGTAGKPMMNVLIKNDLSNIVAIVTRYFGGIKLGAGGLVRAYSHSILKAIEEAEIVNMELFNIYEAIFDYKNIKEVDSELRKYNLKVIKKDYNVQVTYLIASNQIDIISNIEEKFQSDVKIDLIKKDYLEI
ncbi:MAG: YigZ family protein [Methanobrevibacter boviskoreani]|uniref:YigZ family protein n=1 Tax=Methanobrevibacter boviskoreani TaxID=1348249 RepID=UPI0005938B27|nr:YigZ family protein [Methanobrevibacter boviskoreani]MCI6775609.1 YigZ family protein [Methanobrevibacter boviskoreani]MCI6929964.1 YigZ family protein [Methanobrevibacter boviskoreani]MDD6256652.1 YigZ family protein [Methanobrevibacter boviskoreani]MDY5614290.1 YigZ family protein [Methanobrevibacter boviskoreani]